jgi:hypothetical protein
MIAIVEIKGHKKQIGIELGQGTPEQCLSRMPAEYKFVEWNKNYKGMPLGVKIIGVEITMAINHLTHQRNKQ